MGILANNIEPDEALKALPSEFKWPFANLLAESEKFYSAKLMALNPSAFSKPEDFVFAWSKLKAQLEVVADLKTLLERNDK